jgi:DNA mismatch repair protein MutS2
MPHDEPIAPCPPKTRSDLEWDRVLSAIAARCRGPLGRTMAISLDFSETRGEALRRLGEASEAARLTRDGEPLPVTELADVRDAVLRTRAGGVLSADELRHVGRALEAARVLRRFLSTRRASAPHLHLALTTDATLDTLADELRGAFDPDGTLADHASPRLRELRSEFRAARARMLSRLEELMRRYEGILQDTFVTEREGRWVLPVRSDAHERFPGIVHGTSASGATLFVEPRAVIPMGNRLKVLEAEVVREELVVLARLSSLLQDALASVMAAVDALAHADYLRAVGELAHDLRLHFPVVSEVAEISLERARHPLLVLDGVDVVPSDAAVRARHAVVISGPNAGGKTVVLKTLGLSALMVRAGLPVPAGEGSRVGLFDVVLTDIGDDQSLHKNLSTFSAHVKNLAEVLDATHEGALVLLDEVATGTDPREGEALAAGVLDSLTARGGAVVATTHYEGLKALALADARFSNASVGFDYTTMTPTFQLALGVPGRSSALAVARRFGIPGTVIERAETFLSREDRTFEETVQKLDDERRALAISRAEAERKALELDERRRELDERIEQAKAKEMRDLTREAEALRKGIERAREALRDAQGTLRQKRIEPHELRAAERTIDKVGRELALGGSLEPLVNKKAAEPPRSPIASESLKKGAKVYVARFRAEAEVLDVSPDGVTVAAGILKAKVPVEELFAPEVIEAPRTTKGAKGSAFGEGPAVAIQTRDNTCDLRGLRADDAVAMATQFLDRSLNDGLRVCFLVHGHGTGAVREAVRAELKESPYVASFRPGTQAEGGDGATVVHLA